MSKIMPINKPYLRCYRPQLSIDKERNEKSRSYLYDLNRLDFSKQKIRYMD